MSTQPAYLSNPPGSAMSDLVDALLAQHSPPVHNPDGSPSAAAMMCAVLVGLKELQGSLARHPSIPGMLRMLTPGQGKDGPVMVESNFHVDTITFIQVIRADIDLAGPRIRLA